MTPRTLFLRTRRGPQGCRIWLGAKNDSGYGVVRVNGVLMKAHRYAYELVHGPIPEGHDINHRCHDEDLDCPKGACTHRLCINPKHLEAVTIYDNRVAFTQKRRARIKERIESHGR